MSNNTFDKPVKMSQFFDEKASGYDQHMKRTVTSFEKFYNIILVPIERTKEAVEILDLGCGTGLELEGIFSKAPNAVITCIDLSEKMLSKLKSKYSRFLDQIKPIRGSYLMVPFPEKKYDYIVSVMTMHHFPYDTKCKLYKKIRKSMKNEGKYIEGDYVVSLEKERQFLLEYNHKIKNIKESERNIFHIDIPFSIKTQSQLLLKGGFSKVKVIFHQNEAAIFVARVCNFG